MAWLFPDQRTEYSVRVRAESLARQSTMPTLWRLEVLNALLVAERQKRLSLREADGFLEALGQMPITLVDELPPPHKILGLARRYQLTSYDATYLAFALDRDL